MSATQFMGGPATGVKHAATANLASRAAVGGYGMPGGGMAFYGNMASPPYGGSLYPGRYPTLNSPTWNTLGYNNGNQQPYLNNTALSQASRMTTGQPPAVPPLAQQPTGPKETDADILVAPGLGHAKRTANLEYQEILKANAFLFACLPERQQSVMATNLYEFLTIVRGRRFIHKNATGDSYVGNPASGPYMIAQEIGSEPCRLAAQRTNPSWVLHGIVKTSDVVEKKQIWVRRDPKGMSSTGWKHLSLEELRAWLVEEGFVNLLLLPNGVTAVKVVPPKAAGGSAKKTVTKKGAVKDSTKNSVKEKKIPKDKEKEESTKPVKAKKTEDKKETEGRENKQETKKKTPKGKKDTSKEEDKDTSKEEDEQKEEKVTKSTKKPTKAKKEEKEVEKKEKEEEKEKAKATKKKTPTKPKKNQTKKVTEEEEDGEKGTKAAKKMETVSKGKKRKTPEKEEEEEEVDEEEEEKEETPSRRKSTRSNAASPSSKAEKKQPAKANAKKAVSPKKENKSKAKMPPVRESKMRSSSTPPKGRRSKRTRLS